MDKYIIPFLISFFLCIVFILVGIYSGRWIGGRGRRESRHIHGRKIVRLGGVAMILAFNLAIIFDRNLVITNELVGVMSATMLILIIGVWDDFKEIFWKTQLFYQVSISILVFILGVRISYVTNPFSGGIINFNSSFGMLASVILGIFWMILMMNSMNWLDGIDGLSGGVSFIGAVTIFILSLKPEVNQPPMAILAAILAGVTLGFLVFNFNPSRIMAGTSGSMFLGFSLATLAIFAGTKIATSVLVMSIPVVDFLWVIGERVVQGKSIFQPDKSHLHYKLIDLGWSQKKTAFYFYVVTALISLVALNTRFIGKSITLILVVLIMVFSVLVINRKAHKKS